MGGRLAHFLPAWLHSKAPPWILNLTRRGYHWTWSQSPPPLALPTLSPQNEIVSALVEKMLSKGAIYEVPLQHCFLSRIFHVPKSDGSHRLVIDLVRLNNHISSPSFSLTGHQALRKTLSLPAWMASLDIRDAFLHVPVRRNLHKFLAITAMNRLFFFRTLPFGLTTSPRTFTFVMRHPLALLHAAGVPAIAYLDDLCLWGDSPQDVLASVEKASTILGELGFLLNLQKSTLTPTRSLTWLGVVWNSETGTVRVPEIFAQEIAAMARDMLHRGQTSRLRFEALLGKIAFASQFSPVARLHSHEIAKPQLIASRDHDKTLAPIPPQLSLALLSWVNPRFLSLPAPIRPPPHDVTVWSDASLIGWGAITSSDLCLSGLWSTEQSNLHINQLEILAVHLTLMRLPRDMSFLIMSDNRTTVAAINHYGSRSPAIQSVAVRLFRHAWAANQLLSALYIPGPENVVADLLSRDKPVDAEWELSPESFLDLEGLAGSFEVDLFASPLNHKLEKFVTTFPHPRAWATNAFCLDWNQFSSIYLFPPPNALPRVISKLNRFKGHGVLVTPKRPTAPWFPLLMKKFTPLAVHLRVTQLVQRQTLEHSQTRSAPWIAFLF